MFVTESSCRTKHSLKNSGHPVYILGYPKLSDIGALFSQIIPEICCGWWQVLPILLSNSSHSSSMMLMTRLCGDHLINCRLFLCCRSFKLSLHSVAVYFGLLSFIYTQLWQIKRLLDVTALFCNIWIFFPKVASIFLRSHILA